MHVSQLRHAVHAFAWIAGRKTEIPRCRDRKLSYYFIELTAGKVRWLALGGGIVVQV
jgi:hypothetical protein